MEMSHALSKMASCRWRRSLEQQQVECQRAQEALMRVTSCFQQLSSSLGSSADGSFLREELDETRTLAHRISQGLSRRLVRLLSDSDPAPSHDGQLSERQVSERLWVNFLSSMENFLSDLRRAGDLIGQFPLTQRSDRRSLVNTGCMDGVMGVAGRVASVQIPWITLDEDPAPVLNQHISSIDAQLSHLQLRVPVAFWSVEPSESLEAEVRSELDLDQSLEELMTVPVVTPGNDSCCCV